MCQLPVKDGAFAGNDSGQLVLTAGLWMNQEGEFGVAYQPSALRD